MKIILASGSPRRAKILAAHRVDFEIRKTDAPEVAYPNDPERTVRENALAKGRAAHAERVLSADTIVWHDGRIYGKPRDLAEAKVFLRTLSGRTHTVFTGVAFDGDVRVVRSDVTFRELTDADIDAYVADVSPLDRAGAYDIDTSGDRIVAGWTGSYENIMGLPVEPLRDWGLVADDRAQELVARALEMVCRAYAPYSRFQVGAAVLADSGRIYGGANVENASYGATVCAERNAVFAAVNAGERRIRAIAVCGGRDGVITDYCPPCGLCRQVLREFCDPADCTVLVVRSASDWRSFTLAQLLPESFGPEMLGDDISVAVTAGAIPFDRLTEKKG